MRFEFFFPTSPKKMTKGTKNVSRSAKAGISFPIGRIDSFMKSSSLTKRVGSTAPVFMAAALEQLTAELLELAAKFTRDGNRRRITPRYVRLAVGNDPEFRELLADISIGEGGVMPTLAERRKKKKDSIITE